MRQWKIFKVTEKPFFKKNIKWNKNKSCLKEKFAAGEALRKDTNEDYAKHSNLCRNTMVELITVSQALSMSYLKDESKYDLFPNCLSLPL